MKKTKPAEPDSIERQTVKHTTAELRLLALTLLDMADHDVCVHLGHLYAIDAHALPAATEAMGADDLASFALDIALCHAVTLKYPESVPGGDPLQRAAAMYTTPTAEEAAA